MLCPGCGHDNLPGADQCAECQTSLTQEDVPTAVIRSRNEKSVTEESESCEIVKLTEEIEKPSWAQSLFDKIDEIDKELIES